MKDADRPLWERSTYLYRQFGTRGQLIYVGISQNWRQRLEMHRKNSPWWKYVAHVEICEYPNRGLAFAAESWAIQHELPLMNTEEQTKHAPSVLPEPTASYGHRIRRWSYSGDEEFPPEEFPE